MPQPSPSELNYSTSSNTKAFTGSQRGSETPTEAIGFYRSKRPGDHPGLSLFPAPIDAVVRETLLEVTGVDVWLLSSLSLPAPCRKKALWRIHGMRCDVCGRTWEDNITLARHHKIPQRLCLLLGLARWQSWHESNMAVLCDEHHELADKALRGAIVQRLPNLYCWKVR